MDICFGVIAAVCIGRQKPVEPYVVPTPDEVLGLTEGHEAVCLQTQKAEGCEVVVEHECVHILRGESGPGPQVKGGMDRLGDGEVWPVEDPVSSRACPLGRRLHQGQGTSMAQLACARSGLVITMAAAPSFS